MSDEIAGGPRAAGSGPSRDGGANPLVPDATHAPDAPGGHGPPAPARPELLGPAVRAVLAVYGAALLVTGVWAAGAPRSFYDDFPGLGRVWVAVDGPYNEHLVRDVGTLNLALAALLVVAAVRATPALVAVAAGANLVNAVPHMAYHALNLDLHETADQVANMTVLALSVLAPVGLLLHLTRRR